LIAVRVKPYRVKPYRYTEISGGAATEMEPDRFSISGKRLVL